MRRTSTLKLVATVAALGLAAAVPARADIITALASAPTAVGNGYYAYTYNVQLQGGQLDATNGSATNPTPLQFGTVYDFGAMQMDTNGNVVYSTTGLLNSAFVFSFAGLSTPAASNTSPTDNPNLANIRFTYDGTSNYIVAGQSTTLASYNTLPVSTSNLGTFTVYSPLSTYSTTTNNYDGQTYKGTNDTVQGNVGFVGAPTAVPEPASLAVLGAGLLGLGIFRRRRA